MKPVRVSMAAMMGLVAVSGVGLASMKYSTVVWTSIASTLTLGLLLASVLGVLFLRGPERGFWSGFALFGLVYLALVNWSAVGGQTGQGLTGGLGDLAEWVYPAEPTIPVAPTGAASRMRTVPPKMALQPAQRYKDAQSRYIRMGNFVTIGRYWLGLAFAMVGGLVGLYFWEKGARGVESDSGSVQGR